MKKKENNWYVNNSKNMIGQEMWEKDWEAKWRIYREILAYSEGKKLVTLYEFLPL